jgi:hypothetical protein
MRSWAQRRGVVLGVCGAALTAASAQSALAKQAAVSFKAKSWDVGTGGILALPPTGTTTHHTKVSPNGTFALCNMGQFANLSLTFTYKNTPGRVFDKHGKLITPYRYTFKGPEGSQSSSYATFHKSGTGAFVWGFVGDFPGHKSAAQPIPAGTYTFTLKQHSRTLMRTSITFTSTNTC